VLEIDVTPDFLIMLACGKNDYRQFIGFADKEGYWL
jgi:hypothetical protein